MTFPIPTTVAQAFAHSVSTFPTNTAVIPLEGPAISYAELGARVAQSATMLKNLGCRPGERIAVWLPNGLDWIVLQYTAALLGLCIVPVNARYRPDEAERVLAKTRVRYLFMQQNFLTNNYVERLKEIAGGSLGEGEQASIEILPELKHIVMVDDFEVPGTITRAKLAKDAGTVYEDLQSLASQRSPDDVLWMFWTSGTTSAPKGALLQQSAISNVWNWTSLAGYRADDRVLMSRPLFYIAGNFWSMLAPMLHGAATVVGQHFTAEEIVELCRKHRVTILSGNPLLLKNLVHDAAFDSTAFESVRFGYFGGTSISLEEFREIKSKIGFEYMLQPYGMTELEGFATSTRPDDPVDISYETCGTPLPGIEMRLIDPETEQPVPVGQPGMVITRGRGFIGYEGLSDEDHAKLFTADGWFKTGDLLQQREDGRYEFMGRVKDLIKVGGENVTAAEIEITLADHPAIAQVVVVPMADERRGEVPAAFVELMDEATLSLTELKVWCHERMAPYKIPAALRFVEHGGWPLTASGKIAKHQLKVS